MPEFESVKKEKKKKKKQSVFRTLFPTKGDSTGEVIQKIIFLLAILVLIGSTITIVIVYFFRPMDTQRASDDLLNLRGESNGDTVSISINVKNSSGETEQKNVTILKEYENYVKENQDMVGYVEIFPWIQSPIVQTNDNDFYLTHNFYKEEAQYGTVFADYEIPITPDSTPPNTILYGHYMPSTKNMFTPLEHYKDGIDFLKDHYLISYDTLYEKNHYFIFSVMLLNTDPSRTNPESGDEMFPFWNYATINSKDEFNYYVSECLDRSYYYTGIDLQYGDELLTLVTCDYSTFVDDMRLVVVARKVRDNESSVLDTDKFIDNSGFNDDGYIQRKMFYHYYQIYGGDTWAGRHWDPAWLKDSE